MSTTGLVIVSVGMMIALFVVLMWGIVSPVIAISMIPVIACVICGFPLEDVGSWVTAGLKQQVSTIAMFVFAIIFFSCIMDTGLFDAILGKLLKNAKNVTMVCIITVIATMLGHLDGSGATTFLLVIPPMIVIYRAMNIRPVVLMGLVSLTAGVMNMLPWGGPCARVAIGLEMAPNDIFLAAFPGMVIGLVCMFVLAVILARVEIKRGAGVPEGTNIAELLQAGTENDPEKQKLLRPRLYWFNAVLIGVTLVAIFTVSGVPTALIFALAGGLALMVNYPSAKEQSARLKTYAPTCMTMVTIGMAAGIYVGIFNNSPLSTALSDVLTAIMGGSTTAHLNTIMGYLWAPLATVGLNHEATVYTIIPIISKLCADYLEPAQVGATYLMTFSTRVFANPITAAMYVGLGLSGVELKDHLRFTLPIALIISTIVMTFALLFRVIPF